MPIYEYRCLNCGSSSEAIQKFSDPPLETCDICSGKLERCLDAPAVHFKGGGWASDGYASKKSDSKDVVEKSRKALVDSTN